MRIVKITILVLFICIQFNLKSQSLNHVWSQVGALNNPLNGQVAQIVNLKTVGSNLYATLFTNADTSITVAKWNNLYWTYYPKIGMNSFNSIDELNDTLFLSWGDLSGKLRISKFVGGQWVNVTIPDIKPSSSNGKIVTLNNELYLYGTITDSISGEIGILKYKNGIWSKVGPVTKPGVNGNVAKLFTYQGNILVCGSSTLSANFNSLSSRYLVWNGSAWSKLNAALDSVTMLYNDNDTLFYQKDTIGALGTQRFYKYFNGTSSNINYNLILTGGATPNFLSINGTYYLFDFNTSSKGLQVLKNNIWYSISTNYYPRRLLTNFNNSLHDGSVNGTQVERLNTNLAFIRGNIYKDLNSNCTKDGAELSIANSRKIIVLPDNLTVLTDNKGDYTAGVLAGSKMIICGRLYGSKYLLSSTCSSDTLNINAVADSTIVADFPMRDSANVNDITLNIFAQGGYRIRKSLNEKVRVELRNNGTIISAGIVNLKLDSRLTIISSSPAYSTFTNNIVTWDFTNFKVDSTKYFELTLTVANSSVLGDSIDYKAWATPNPDADSTDNIDSLKCVIVGSYDPNDKQCYPANIIYPNTTSLAYLIRFQNTGTSDAINVHIVDTIDTKLPIEKILITGWSTPVRPTIEILQGRILVFTFPNIMLPDSHANEPKSHGFISYRCALTTDLPLNTKIYNRAYIYFDYNDPVQTNTTENMRTDKIGINKVYGGSSTIKIYPNPANDIINIDFRANSGISNQMVVKIYDLNGREVLSEKVSKDAVLGQINIQGIENGLYLINVFDGTHLMRAQKLVVQH